MDDRYQSAEELAEAVTNWLDGVKKQEQALRVVEEALTLTEETNRLQQEASRLNIEAIEQLEQIPSWENELVKSTWWAQEKKAAKLLNQAILLDTIQEQKLQGALTHTSDLEEAHIALAARYRSQHEQAEQIRNLQQITQTETRLREHATALPKDHPERISHFYYMKGTGAVSLQTDVDDVEVILEQYVSHHRRLIPKTIAHLGCVPIVSHSLEMGSYRLVLKKTGYHDVSYPIAIGRGQHWDGIDPTGTQRPIMMPKLGTLGSDDCYVPAGWFTSSGDEQSNSTLSQRRIWIESFVAKRFPVTNRNFLYFLNTLFHEGREEDALRWVPRERSGQSNQLGAMIYGRNDNGDFILVPDADGDMWELDWPVCMVDWHGSMAYATWKSKQEHTLAIAS